MSNFIGKFTNIIRILMMTTVVIDDRRISLLTIDPKDVKITPWVSNETVFLAVICKFSTHSL